MVFCIYEEGEPEVEFVPLLDQELVAIVPPDHPLAAEDQILLSQLAPYPFITYMPHVQIYRDIMAYISQSGWTLRYSAMPPERPASPLWWPAASESPSWPKRMCWTTAK